VKSESLLSKETGNLFTIRATIFFSKNILLHGVSFKICSSLIISNLVCYCPSVAEQDASRNVAILFQFKCYNNMNMTSVWNVTRCSLFIDVSEERTDSVFSPENILKKYTTRILGRSVDFHQTIRRHMSEGGEVATTRTSNLTSVKFLCGHELIIQLLVVPSDCT
jgi:hypothetical protein